MAHVWFQCLEKGYLEKRPKHYLEPNLDPDLYPYELCLGKTMVFFFFLMVDHTKISTKKMHTKR